MKKAIRKKTIASIFLLSGGVLLGIIYETINNMTAELKGDLLQMLLPLIIVAIIIAGFGIYILFKD